MHPITNAASGCQGLCMMTSMHTWRHMQCLLKGCRVIELDCYNKQPGFQVRGIIRSIVLNCSCHCSLYVHLSPAQH